MKPSSAPIPLSRPLPVLSLPDVGRDVTVEASEPERAALAKAFGLVAISALTGRFLVKPGAGGAVVVTGTVAGTVTQTCTVSLDPFDASVDEAVDMTFMPESGVAAWLAKYRPDPNEDLEYDIDPPDLIDDGKIDLGAITAEFMALGLDPHPRKPGVAFEAEQTGAEKDPSPFAALAQWKPKE